MAKDLKTKTSIIAIKTILENMTGSDDDWKNIVKIALKHLPPVTAWGQKRLNQFQKGNRTHERPHAKKTRKARDI